MSQNGNDANPQSWKTAYRSFYYADAPEPVAPPLDPATTALLVIDVQNTYRDRPDPQTLSARERARYDAWTPFHARFENVLVPNIGALLTHCRDLGIECMFARIAALKRDGRDRSLSQKLPGWNNILLPHRDTPSQIVPELAPLEDEIVVTKTTDSAVTGTNLRLLLDNMGIRTVICVGVFTDQCVSSTVRSLADESFHVVVVEDCCAAGTDELHHRELEIINNIYCNVMSSQELRALIAAQVQATGG
jgi:nicotinamidase-related amidase